MPKTAIKYQGPLFYEEDEIFFQLAKYILSQNLFLEEVIKMLISTNLHCNVRWALSSDDTI